VYVAKLSEKQSKNISLIKQETPDIAMASLL